MQCEDIFQDFVVQCPETLKVNAQLDPGETYTWVITDKFGKEYSGEVISDADGHLNIPIEDLPVGLLTHYSGSFKLKILSGGAYLNEQCFPIKFLMAKYYDEIVFEVKAGTNVKNNLGCEFDCTLGTSFTQTKYYPIVGVGSPFVATVTNEELENVEIQSVFVTFPQYGPALLLPVATLPIISEYRYTAGTGTIEAFTFSNVGVSGFLTVTFVP